MPETNNDAPLSFTVVIPAYNASESIRRSISSAFDAGASAVIVVDDGSSDDTAAVAESAGARCIRQENAGASKARLTGGAQVTTDFVAFLDSDDVFVPDAVRRSVQLLMEREDLAVAAGTVIGLGPSGVRTPFPIRYSPVDSTSLLVKGFGPWPPAAEVVRVSAYRDALATQPPALHLRFADDYELLIRLSLVGKIDVRPEATCVYSMVGGKSVRSAKSAIEAKEAIRRHYASHLGLTIQTMSPRGIEAAAHVRLARARLSAKDYPGFAVEMAKWLFSDPAGAVKKLRRSVVR